MGHVGDAMKKFQSEQPPPEAPAKGAPPKATPGAGAAAPTAAEPPHTMLAGLVETGAAPAPPTNNRIPSDGFSRSLIAHYDRGDNATEQYRVIRTNMMAKFPERRFCTMITSAEPNEGKTATSLNLGIVLAEAQEGRTVVVDMDLRKGRIASFLGVNRAPGVTDVLRGQSRLRDALRTTEYPGLDILTAGQARTAEVGELLTRPELGEMLAELRQRYSFVLIDTPPVNEISDAGTIGRFTCGAMLVVAMYKTRRESVRKAVRLLRAVNIEVLGMVLTKQKFYIPGYLYRYS